MADVPNISLPLLANSPLVKRVALDRLILGATERTGATVGATAVRQATGYDGSGVGVAVIDSGITPWHDDLSQNGLGSQRVDQFVDFVNGRTTPYDDYGHGTHVAGIIAGNGFDSNGARSGIAPAARLVVLKVLDQAGRGRISNVIAALDYVVAHKDDLQYPDRQPVGRRRRVRVVQHRSPHACGQEGGRAGHRGRRGGRQRRQGFPGPATSMAASRRRAMLPGC